MKRFLPTGYRAWAACAALTAAGLWTMGSAPTLAADVSLSISVPGVAVHTGPAGAAISVAQPGFYGELSVGALPAPPAVIYAQPVLIERVAQPVAPIYLRVPPGYERHWAEHCAYYHACARPVYFVRDDWYQRVYVPHYRQIEQERRFREERLHAAAHERAVEHAREDWHEHDRAYPARVERDFDHDQGRDFDHDHGRDHDHGHGHGHGHDRGD